MRNTSTHFTIHNDSSLGLVWVKTMGHWDAETLQTFEHALRHAINQMVQMRGAAAVKVLVDARESSVQSAEVVTRFQILSDELSSSVGKVAAIVSGALHKMQANRIASMESHRGFLDELSARNWLFDQ